MTDGPDRIATDDERQRAMDCLRCGSVVTAEGPVELRFGGRTGGWSVFLGGWADISEGLMKLDLFTCPKCGHVEFRVPKA